MAGLPSQYPSLSLHLSDITLTPLITSAASQSHLESLTSLTSSALASQTAALRLGLGRPTRLMVEYPDRGPVVLHSYIDPRDTADTPGGSDVHTTSAASPGTADPSAALSEPPPNPKDDPRSEDAAPMLIGVVVAGSAEEAREARRAAARLENVGREFQREWVTESQGQEDASE